MSVAWNGLGEAGLLGLGVMMAAVRLATGQCCSSAAIVLVYLLGLLGDWSMQPHVLMASRPHCTHGIALGGVLLNGS